MKAFSRSMNLFLVLARMHLRASDYRSLLGALWSLVGPALAFAVLYFIFIDRFGQQMPRFALHLLVGIVSLNFFIRVVQTSMQAFLESRDMVIHSVAPTGVLLTAPLVVPFVRFTVEMALCAAVSYAAGALHLREAGLLAGLMVLYMILALGLGLVLSVLNALAADVHEIWAALSPLFFFLTPIFYSLDMLSPWGRTLVYWLNPLTPFVLGFKKSVIGGAIPFFSAGTVALAVFYSLAALALGFALLKKFEKQILEGL